MRKKITMAAIALAAVTQLNAQFIKKGTVTAGADISSNFDRTKYYDFANRLDFYKTSLFQLEASKAIKNNLVAGIRLGKGSTPSYNFTSFIPGAYSATYRSNPVFTAGLFVRRYAPLGKRLALFAEGSLTYTGGRFNNSDIDFTGKYYQSKERFSSIDLGFSLGLAWAVSKRINVELAFNNLLSAGFSKTKGSLTYPLTGETGSFKNNEFNYNPNGGASFPNISLGVRIKLGKL
jgi:hypothetical protein